MTPTESSPCLSNKENASLLPLKLHFILLYGASGGVIPYAPVLGKQLGLTATAVGMVYTAQPIAILFAKPGCGSITDYLKSFKLSMMILAVIQAITYSSLLLIPPIHKPIIDDAFTFSCSHNKPGFAVSDQYNQECILDKMKNLTCDFHFQRCSENNTFCNENCDESTYIKGMIFPFNVNDSNITNTSLITISSFFQIANLDSNKEPYELDLVGKYSNVTSPCDCGNSIWKTVKCFPSLGSCLLTEYSEDRFVYSTYQFWVFAVLICIAGACAASLFTLSDAACYEILGSKPELYGNQRMYATVSWGIVTLFSGYLHGVASKGSDIIDYSPGFYIMIGMLLIDLIIVYHMDLSKEKQSPAIWKDIGRVFASAEIVAFAIGVFISGGLCGLLWNYQFWYLQNLGASQLLLGLTIAVQCLLAEFPFFYISGYMVKKFGHFMCLVFTFLANCLRYVLYFFLINPWYTLPIELLHGQTYANFYTTMTSFASEKALPGTEATMLGVLGGIFEGLGVACGSFFSGVGFDHIGDRYTFLAAGVIAGGSAILFLIIKLFFGWWNARNVAVTTDSDENLKTSEQTDV